MACCYDTVPLPDLHDTPDEHHKKTAPDTSTTINTTGAATRGPSTACEPYEPPSEAAAFIASASAAALVLMAALLAVVLSFATVLTLVSLVPMADAATDFPSHQQRAADHLHRWHQQLQQPATNQWDATQRLGPPRQPQYGGEDLASRPKRQLLRKNANREPGIVSLAFSLIGGVS